ncbi:formate dehydrogenase-H ferredoxin subunit [Escherichia coli]|uniref:Formate dehydrogenase-H ferredoxin subunit n=1 Tax=Escherichia coli TaxID=562 RepID=A0A2X3K261_ECOLX|nr:formate dehydrogenase-H ferredoxin subunit [Escherichia coli]
MQNLRGGLPVWRDGSGGTSGDPQQRRGAECTADKAEANKCDLCNHREDGPACMAACPTHALICVDRNKLEQTERRKTSPYGADVLKIL